MECIALFERKGGKKGGIVSILDHVNGAKVSPHSLSTS